jgi:multimeric flavodoxin WrbA
MKIMAFVGSPRMGSNTDILIDKVIEGAKSKVEIEAEKIYLFKADIKDCNGCLGHIPMPGNKGCPFKDDMSGIMERMKEADAFIWGSPNHCHTISAAMTNFLARALPLVKMMPILDETGKIIGADTFSEVAGKKCVLVVSQGDFSASASALVLRVLDSNLKDFQLDKVGEVFSMGNILRAEVKKKESDLTKAFEMGQRLART